LSWSRRESDVHVDIGRLIIDSITIIGELHRKFIYKLIQQVGVEKYVTCNILSILDDKCSGPAPSSP
jgi:hypothetical protein